MFDDPRIPLILGVHFKPSRSQSGIPADVHRQGASARSRCLPDPSVPLPARRGVATPRCEPTLWKVAGSQVVKKMAGWLVVSTYPSEKYDMVNWDDDSQSMEK